MAKQNNFPEMAVTRLMNNPDLHTFIIVSIACYAQAMKDSDDKDIDVGDFLTHISPQAWRAQASEVMQIIQEVTQDH